MATCRLEILDSEGLLYDDVELTTLSLHLGAVTFSQSFPSRWVIVLGIAALIIMGTSQLPRFSTRTADTRKGLCESRLLLKACTVREK